MARLRSGRKTEESKEFEEPVRNGLKSEKSDPETERSYSGMQWTVRITGHVIAVIVCIYLASPIISLLFPGAVTQFIFLNLFGRRWFSDDLSYPGSPVYNLTGSRNLYIESTDGVKLGVWQVLPQSVQDKYQQNQDDDFFDKALSDGKPIVVYFHGNGGTRGFGHRVEQYKLLSELDYHIVAVDYRGSLHRVHMYKVLAKVDYHVIAMDYRGFADSTGWPSAEGIFDDGESTYNWAKLAGKGAPVYIWGHSLGSGVASRVSKRLCDKGSCPAGVILETPFNSLHDAFMHHPFGVPFWVMPGYLWLHAYAMNETIGAFNSEQCMASIKCPLLILHAEDDFIVPFHLGKRLYKTAKEVRAHEPADSVQFINFGKNGYGHKHICQAPELPGIIKKFIR